MARAPVTSIERVSAIDRSFERIREIGLPEPDFRIVYEPRRLLPLVLAEGKKFFPMLFYMDHLVTEQENISVLGAEDKVLFSVTGPVAASFENRTTKRQTFVFPG